MINTRKILHIVVFLFWVASSFFFCKRPDPKQTPPPIFQQIKNKKELRVVTVSNPINFFLYKGTPMGFHYEVVKKYVQYLGVKLKLEVVSNYSVALQKLEKGECDLLAMDMKVLANTEKITFSTPFFESQSVLVQNKESKQYIQDWFQSDSIVVGVVKGTPWELSLQNVERELGVTVNIKYVEEKSQEQLINLVANGNDTIPAVLVDKAIGRVGRNHFPQLDIALRGGFSYPVAWAVPKSAEELLIHLNTWLAEFRQTKKYKYLYTKYYLNHQSINNNKKQYLASQVKLSLFDDLIKREATILGWDWRLLASLIYVESQFHEKKKSWRGAFGIMQLMPVTARHYGIDKTATTEEQIVVGRKLLQFLEKELKQNMQDTTDVKKFQLASYNSGLGHMKDVRRLVQKHAANPDKWSEVSDFMVQMTEPEYYKDEVVKHGYFRGKESVNYVNKIYEVYESYVLLVPKD